MCQDILIKPYIHGAATQVDIWLAKYDVKNLLIAEKRKSKSNITEINASNILQMTENESTV